MNLLILGATGGTGLQLVSLALDQFHEVTVLVRDPTKLSLAHDNARVIKGDVLDKNVVMKALEGQDAVLSALGTGKSLRSSNLISNALSILIPGMKAAGIKRLIFLSAFGVGETFNQANFLQKIIYRTFLRSIYTDKAKGEAMIRSSELDWTLVSPVVLTHSPGKGHYQVGEKLEMNGLPKIPRADVAKFMLLQLSDYTYLRKTAVLMS